VKLKESARTQNNEGSGDSNMGGWGSTIKEGKLRVDSKRGEGTQQHHEGLVPMIRGQGRGGVGRHREDHQPKLRKDDAANFPNAPPTEKGRIRKERKKSKGLPHYQARL